VARHCDTSGAGPRFFVDPDEELEAHQALHRVHAQHLRPHRPRPSARVNLAHRCADASSPMIPSTAPAAPAVPRLAPRPLNRQYTCPHKCTPLPAAAPRRAPGPARAPTHLKRAAGARAQFHIHVEEAPGGRALRVGAEEGAVVSVDVLGRDALRSQRHEPLPRRPGAPRRRTRRHPAARASEREEEGGGAGKIKKNRSDE